MGGRNLEGDTKIFQGRSKQQISQRRVTCVAYQGLTVLRTLEAKYPMSFFSLYTLGSCSESRYSLLPEKILTNWKEF